jgi:hypothetical protein
MLASVFPPSSTPKQNEHPVQICLDVRLGTLLLENITIKQNSLQVPMGLHIDLANTTHNLTTLTLPGRSNLPLPLLSLHCRPFINKPAFITSLAYETTITMPLSRNIISPVDRGFLETSSTANMLISALPSRLAVIIQWLRTTHLHIVICIHSNTLAFLFVNEDRPEAVLALKIAGVRVIGC